MNGMEGDLLAIMTGAALQTEVVVVVVGRVRAGVKEEMKAIVVVFLFWGVAGCLVEKRKEGMGGGVFEVYKEKETQQSVLESCVAIARMN